MGDKVTQLYLLLRRQKVELRNFSTQTGDFELLAGLDGAALEVNVRNTRVNVMIIFCILETNYLSEAKLRS